MTARPCPDILFYRISLLTRHIAHVRDNCERLAVYLWENGECDLSLELIARGHRHDQSKFTGIEWAHLHADIKESSPHLFQEALAHHHKHNDHHPEYWTSIQRMPRVSLAEFVCDSLARSQEFGSDIWQWMLEVAMPRYGLTEDSPVYEMICEFLSHLLERRFS